MTFPAMGAHGACLLAKEAADSAVETGAISVAKESVLHHAGPTLSGLERKYEFAIMH